MKTHLFIYLIICSISISAQQKPDPIFYVKNIELIEEYYYIEITKDDSTIFITSKKKDPSDFKCIGEKIEIGKSYYFDIIEPENDTDTSSRIQPLEGVMNKLDIHYVAATDPNTKKDICLINKPHRMVFVKNLIDLYLIPATKDEKENK